MRYYVFFIFAALCVLVGYSNCGQVGESGLTSENSVAEGDPVQGSIVYSVDGNLASCTTCHSADGNGVLGISLNTIADEDIERAVRTGPGSMPMYSNSDLTDQQLLDLLAYIRTL